jgi:predicted ATP-dependent endonuclease of OLD family
LTAKVSKLSNSSHPMNGLFSRYLDEILGFRLGVIASGDNQSTMGIYVTGSSTIAIENMGEGVVNIVGLIATLLTEDKKLYLLEEIENDIHPKALKKLLELILEKSKNNQFVISTHSNIVLKYLGIKSSNIFNLTWKPYDQVTGFRIPTTEIIELENTPENKLNLLEDLGYDIFDFDLYKSYIIFEESSAESLVKDFLIPTFVPELNGKIKTVSATGVDDINARLSDFMRLFVFIHQSPIYYKKAWIIADGDRAGINALEKIKEKFSSWPKEHFINLSKNNIEEFYPKIFSEEFSLINNTEDSNKKRTKKIAFTNKVKQWIEKNPVEAKKEFKVSAKEIINYLQKISNTLKAK